MNARQKSIQILQDAVKNKTLGAYKGATVCRYYDKATDSCCAVGALIPREELMLNLDEVGNVSSLFRDGCGNIASILESDKWENSTGLSDMELIKLQDLHDIIITGNQDPIRFESYVASLV